ncbi:AAA family ATPase [Denitromonas halophila]|uniref:AAA family ATPase n=1 Tax=Denitromonas halophila TaxID=1629404 RepID=A0A557QX40_9RHOO|nr:AAA family ATPase [Denitromonas halophila]TVO57484.1 AAA family ATPase [Denitromonas halophila]
MYLDHYGLREAPFRLTPLTDFFFTGAQRGATVDALVYAVLHDEGIVKVSGEVGAGKTMVCRVLIERLPDTVDTVYLANPSLAPDDLLIAIAAELGLSLGSERSGAVLGAVQEDLVRRHADGRRVVVLIDEAHAMPAASLEQIRLLSNLETGRHKLMQLVLFGQPELDTLLDTRDMRPLKDRITHHFRLSPLAPDEVAAYLDFRMHAAGYRGPAVFSPAAARQIARIAAGLTRRVNVLADKSLLAAFSQNRHVIAPSHVTAAAHDAEYAPPTQRRAVWPLIVAAAAGAMAAVVIPRWLNDTPLSTPPTTSVATSAPSEVAPPVEAPAPVVIATAPRAPNKPAAVVTPPTATPQRTPAVAVAPQAPVPADTRAHPANEPTVRAATPPPVAAPATSKEITAPHVTEPTVTLATVTERSTAAMVTAAPALAIEPASASAVPEFGPLAQAALTDQAAWMASAPDTQWFIQLHTNTNLDYGDLERQLEAARNALPSEQIRIYSAHLGDRHRVGVIMGSYATEQEALAAMRALPGSYRDNAYIRQARRLR